jgi:hypothetical protein
LETEQAMAMNDTETVSENSDIAEYNEQEIHICDHNHE